MVARSKVTQPTSTLPVNTKLYWQGEVDGYGPPDLVITAPMQTMPAVHQDEWWRRSAIPVTEPRWVKMVEIRPANLEGRKILHHSIAYHILSPENAGAVSQGVQIGRGAAPANGQLTPEELVLRRPQLMEWAIGRGYDRYAEARAR